MNLRNPRLFFSVFSVNSVAKGFFALLRTQSVLIRVSPCLTQYRSVLVSAFVRAHQF
jgi:hypothetical protein